MQGFSASVLLGEVEVRVFDGLLHVFVPDTEDGCVFWQSEPLGQAIPKLETLLAAARIAANLQTLGAQEADVA